MFSMWKSFFDIGKWDGVQEAAQVGVGGGFLLLFGDGLVDKRDINVLNKDVFIRLEGHSLRGLLPGHAYMKDENIKRLISMRTAAQLQIAI